MRQLTISQAESQRAFGKRVAQSKCKCCRRKINVHVECVFSHTLKSFILRTKNTLKRIIKVSTFKLPSSLEVLQRDPVLRPERFDPLHVKTLCHGCGVVRKLHNKNFVRSAILAQSLRPAMRVRSILQDHQRSFWVNFAPFRNYPAINVNKRKKSQQRTHHSTSMNSNSSAQLLPDSVANTLVCVPVK